MAESEAAAAPKYELHLRLVEARDVPKMDLFGLSDPYCTIQVSNSRQIYRTKIIDNTKTPVWNDDFRLSITNLETDFFQIVMKDSDDASDDDLISKTNMTVASLGIGKLFDQWIKMQSLTKDVGGDVHLMAVVLPAGSTSPWLA
jgi:Ca2+-dependent lipid-binding protein